jgi:hypothetical protein
MPNNTLNDALNELKDAWNMANNGYKAEPQEGLAGIFSPKYSPLEEVKPSPPPAASRDQSFSDLESRLRQVHQLYESRQIDYQDYERQKTRILDEI